MKKQINFSAIVPCYNDGPQLLNVISAIKSSKLIDEIVLIDDGSDPQTKTTIAKLSGIKLITHSHNRGKTAALHTGFIHSTGQHIFFLDADLQGLTPQVVDDMAKCYLTQKPAMLLGERETSLLFRLTGSELTLTGERIISRDFLLKNPQVFQYPGYLFEAAINLLLFGRKIVFRFPLHGVRQTPKTKKFGIKGLWQDFALHIKLCRFLGIRKYLWQFWFARTQVPLAN